MEINVEMLKEYAIPGIALLCALIGYFIKNSSLMNFINNKDIPLILAAVGVIAICIQSGLSVDNVIKGLSSAGIAVLGHQAIKQNVDNKYLESIDPNDVTGNLADIQAVLNETEEESEAAEETEPTEHEEV